MLKMRLETFSFIANLAISGHSKTLIFFCNICDPPKFEKKQKKHLKSLALCLKQLCILKLANLELIFFGRGGGGLHSQSKITEHSYSVCFSKLHKVMRGCVPTTETNKQPLYSCIGLGAVRFKSTKRMNFTIFQITPPS